MEDAAVPENRGGFFMGNETSRRLRREPSRTVSNLREVDDRIYERIEMTRGFKNFFWQDC